MVAASDDDDDTTSPCSVSSTVDGNVSSDKISSSDLSVKQIEPPGNKGQHSTEATLVEEFSCPQTSFIRSRSSCWRVPLLVLLFALTLPVLLEAFSTIYILAWSWLLVDACGFGCCCC